MLPLGLLLVIAAGAAGAAVALHNTDAGTLTAFGQSYDTTVLGVFLTGAVAGLALMAGLSMMVGGAAGRRRRHAAAKAQVRDVSAENDQLADENARLRAQVADPYPTETTRNRSGRHSVT
ncbi:MAG: hypothetical protein ABR549_09165 [Mycobacteriales bacterium]